MAEAETAQTDPAQPFWDGIAGDSLVMQRCAHDQHIRFPIQDSCPVCLSEDYDWVPLSGRGSVLSKVTFHRAYKPEWADRIPYDVLFVQLDEGPRMFSAPARGQQGRIEIGDRVTARFEEVQPGSRLPVFTKEGD
jgi:uncharacterized OB-fold protein